MKLGEMSFEESRAAELIIIPEIEEMWKNETTAEILDSVFGGKSAMKRGQAIKTLVSHLVCSHFDQICRIFAALNPVSVDDVKMWKRSDANKSFASLFNDEDLVSFFMSSEALEEAVQSASLQAQEKSRLKRQ